MGECGPRHHIGNIVAEAVSQSVRLRIWGSEVCHLRTKLRTRGSSLCCPAITAARGTFSPTIRTVSSPIDLVIARIDAPLDVSLGEDLAVEKLFDDGVVLATAATSKWARRKTVRLSELQ